MAAHVSDAQAAVWIRMIREWTDCRGELPCVKLIPLDALGLLLSRCCSSLEVARKDQISTKLSLEGRGAPIAGDGLINLALIQQNIAATKPCFSKIGLQCQCLVKSC